MLSDMVVKCPLSTIAARRLNELSSASSLVIRPRLALSPGRGSSSSKAEGIELLETTEQRARAYF